MQDNFFGKVVAKSVWQWSTDKFPASLLMTFMLMWPVVDGPVRKRWITVTRSDNAVATFRGLRVKYSLTMRLLPPVVNVDLVSRYRCRNKNC